MRLRALTYGLMAVLLLGGLVRADEEEGKRIADLASRLKDVLQAEDPQQAAGPIAWMLTATGGPESLEKALPKARVLAGGEASDDEAARLKKWEIEVGGREHTLFVQLPSSYVPEKSWPVLVWLHGAVSREPDGGGMSGIRNLGADAEKEGYILVAPSGRRGAEWWTARGMELIEKSLHTVVRNVHVDARRIAVGGFSDGASACYHLLAHAPQRFCCFLALHGHPGLTRNLYGPCFKANLNSRPVYATNGEVDQLYPAERMKPLIEQMTDAGARIEWQEIIGSGHNMQGMAPYWDEAKAFWKKHTLPESPKSLVWETRVAAESGRNGWLEIVDIDAERTGSLASSGAHLEPLPGRRQLGIRLDPEFGGPGLKIASVTEGSAASEGGLLEGDILVSVEGTALGGPQTATILREKIQGYDESSKTGLVFQVKRGDETIEISTRPKRPTVPGYDQAVARIEGTWKNPNTLEIKTRHVKSVRVYLDPRQFDKSKPLNITLDGKVVHSRSVDFQPAVRLVEAARFGAGWPAYGASLLLTVPKVPRADKTEK